jgi:hypothetical protein
LPGGTSRGQTPIGDMTGWTRAIVRLEGGNRVVTKGYRKGVYEWVTKGIKGRNVELRPLLVQKRYVVTVATECNLPAAL